MTVLEAEPTKPLLFSDIQARVSGPLAQFKDFLLNEVDDFEPEIQDLVRYCFAHQGKQLRPLLVFYASGYKGGDVSQGLLRIAAIVELIHLATLVHDDIIDGASLRHGVESVAAKAGPEVAVLLGDALFSHALKLASDFPTTEVCRAAALTTRRLCAGEIGQTFARGDVAYSLDAYFRAIDLKTAELFAVSCQLGAFASGFSLEDQKALERYGRYLGQVYQIYDDISDLLGAEAEIGKTLGTDLVSKKYTLPVLLYLKKMPSDERKVFENALGEGALAPDQIISRLKEAGIFKDVVAYYDSQVDLARDAIASIKGNEGLLDLASFTAQLIHRYL